MWNVIYLIVIIVGISSQNIFKKPYTDKTGGRAVYWFNTILSFSAVLFFVVTAKNLQFHSGLVPYAIGFAVTYMMASVFSVKAISCGVLSLTALFSSYSLMIPTFYGLIWLKDPISKGFVPGILLLAVSLYLINKKSETCNISLRWIVYVILAVFGNGMCTIFQKMQQVAMDGGYKNEFMILALGMVSLTMFILAVFGERREFQVFTKGGCHWAVLCGLMNGMVNLFVMILSKRMPVSLMFPLISSGGIIITASVARLVYKEKMTRIQFIGFLTGIASVIFLNL